MPPADPLPPWLRPTSEGCEIEVHVQPRASRSAVEGEHGGRLRVALRAPPTDGRANEELCRLLSDRLGVPKSAVTLLRGAGDRRKAVAVRGCEAARALACLVPPA